MLSPEYVAVIVSLPPTGRLEVVHVAVPGLPDVTDVVPQPVFPLHVTVPVTVIGFAPFFRPRTCPFAPLIVAVNVTDSPYVEGFSPEATLTPTPAELTTCPPASVPELPLLLVLPEYTAVTVCVPAVSVEVLPDVAEPELSVTGESNAFPSMLNCTVPVGLDPVTLAVKLTAWP